MTVFTKVLSSNDVGATGTHQSGILIPKYEAINFPFPSLDATQKNPDAPMRCFDERQCAHDLRFVYYNNRLHDENGTRDEYRITCVTSFLQQEHAKEGDLFELSLDDGSDNYRIRIMRR